MFHLETVFMSQSGWELIYEMNIIVAYPCKFVVKNESKGIAPGIINNVNLLFPLYGDKGVILYLINAEDHFGNWLMSLWSHYHENVH